MPMTLGDALAYFSENDPRGEFVLVLEGKGLAGKREEKRKEWLEIPLEEHMRYYEGQGINRKEAMKLVAKDRGVGKREIYQALLSDAALE